MKRNLVKKLCLTGSLLLAGIIWPLNFQLTPNPISEKQKEKIYTYFEKISKEYEKKLAQEKRIYEIMNAEPYSKKQVHQLIHENFRKIKPKYLDEGLIKAITEQESQYKQFATSSAGAKSFMQVMNETYLGEKIDGKYPNGKTSADTINLYIPEININEGIKNIKGIEKYCEINHPNWENLNLEEKQNIILAAYNGGQGKLNKLGWDISKMGRETRKYAPAVFEIYNKEYNK